LKLAWLTAKIRAVKKTSQFALFQRTALLLGPAGMKRIAECRVSIFGVGGVGSWCAESLVRTGFKHLTLVDSDLICATNVNRQAQATALNIGAVKVEALRQRLLEINPQAEIQALQAAYDDKNSAQFQLAHFDYVVDAIDSLQNKIKLIEQCHLLGLKCFSSMGAAARLDPSMIRVGTIQDTTGCPLARAVRRRLRQLKVPLASTTCVYSLEPSLAPIGDIHCGTSQCLCATAKPEGPDTGPDWCALKAQINGAVVHVTAVFGFTLASLIVRDALSSLPKQDRSPSLMTNRNPP
jgi:tRNA threonylcarbamoyladenosine dehydratase